ncbi:MAG TPA: hypothetical protein VM238_22955 [Phycisphaerae bacterium]|nr:hypothetical protein [Phycisphaerae bacterium]
MNWSKTQICNAALGLVGAGSIGNYDDAAERSTEAQRCRFYFPILLQSVLESFPWKCVAKPAVLTATTEEPPFGYAYAYVLPADWVRMIGMDHPSRKYLVYGRALHTNASPACISYVPLEMDATKYSAGLVRCLYLNLGYELALSLRQDPELANQMRRDLEQFFLPVVRMADAAGQGVRTLSQGTLTEMFDE